MADGNENDTPKAVNASISPTGTRAHRCTAARTFDTRITFAQLSDAERVVARHCRAGGHARGVTGTLLVALHGCLPIRMRQSQLNEKEEMTVMRMIDDSVGQPNDANHKEVNLEA